MAFNIFKRKSEVIDDYEIKPFKPKGTFTEEDRESSSRTRRKKAQLKQLEMALEERRIKREMDRDEFDYQIEQEERLEKLKSLKIDNLKGNGDSNTEDTMFMHLLSLISSKSPPQVPQTQPQQPFTNTNFNENVNIDNSTPLSDEEWKPNSRFTNVQMTELLKKMPGQVIKTMQSMEEDEILQAYDIIKTM